MDVRFHEDRRFVLDLIYGEARLYELNRSSTDVRFKELQAETLPSSDRSRIRIGKFRSEAYMRSANPIGRANSARLFFLLIEPAF
jgi:hypothetical protein